MNIKHGIQEFEKEFLETKEGKFKLQEKDNEIFRLKTAMDKLNSAYRETELPIPSNSYSFGLIGDTHLGSLYERLDNLRSFYKICKSKNITTIFHSGDVIDGHNMYKGQEFEQKYIGYKDQLKHVENNYPQDKSITTYFIAGNHDQSFNKQVGTDVGMDIQKARPDLKFMGNNSTIIKLKTPSNRNFIIGLNHPGGGTAYAISYRAQKIVESLSGGSKPHLLSIGHYHKADMLPEYRNVCVIQTGCFQWQTPFMESKATPAHVGGWIITFTAGADKSLTNAIAAQFFAYY